MSLKTGKDKFVELRKLIEGDLCFDETRLLMYATDASEN